jgi:hypothetical protein
VVSRKQELGCLQDRLRHAFLKFGGENMATMARARPRASQSEIARIEEAARIHEQIRQRAYELYLLRGCTPGLDLDDWLSAAQEIVQAEMAWLDERTTEIR